jgi:transcriptional regulator with XRE-family HTH domain
MSTFGTRTIALRTALGRTQKEFGALGDLTQSNLSNAENDKTVPNLDFVMNIKKAFPQIDLNWWIHGDGNMFLFDIKRKSLPDNVNPSIKEFLEELHDQVMKMSETNKLIEIITKKK